MTLREYDAYVRVFEELPNLIDVAEQTEIPQFIDYDKYMGIESRLERRMLQLEEKLKKMQSGG